MNADMEYVVNQERLAAAEYIEFLKTTDLGSQYPAERFEKRIETLVASASISLVARTVSGEIAGVLLGLTDFAYWLFITDLGVARAHLRRGVGSLLMKKAHEIAGGEQDVAVYLVANENAIPFYEKLGMRRSEDGMEYNKIEWTSFTVK